MAWKIEIEAGAAKAVRRFPSQDQARILNRLNQLAIDPHDARNVKSMQGRDGYRLRVGDYRVMYRLDGKHLIVVVIEVSQRGGAYR